MILNMEETITLPKPAQLRPPKQSRSRRTLERIVSASLELLETEGLTGLTVHKVVARAESSVGSFYARFDGKEDLLDYLGERVWTEALARWEAALETRDWSALGLEEVIEGSVDLLIDAQRSRSTYLKALDWASGRQNDAYETFRGELLTGLGRLLLKHRDTITHPDPALAVRIGLRAILGAVDAETRAAQDQLARDAIAAEARTLLLGYLTGNTSGADRAIGVDFFDVWG
jgi:AcrR family transcriptional regulator